jgi:hypothetical protein
MSTHIPNLFRSTLGKNSVFVRIVVDAINGVGVLVCTVKWYFTLQTISCNFYWEPISGPCNVINGLKEFNEG